MRMRALLVVAITALALPPTGAHATGQCATHIFLFSGDHVPGAETDTQTVTPSAIGCTVVGSDDPNTDYIYPGSDSWFVRWTTTSVPSRGSLTFGGQTIPLHFAPGKLFGVVDGQAWLDSQWIPIDPTSTIAGGEAVITVCVGQDADEECDIRTYRTVA